MNNIFVNPENQQYKLYGAVNDWLDQLVEDIRHAEKYIYIETFRFNDDDAGRKVCEALIEQAKKGLDIRLIVDSWGTRRSTLFTKMQEQGIAIRFFKKIVLTLNWFGKNHERNHRKIIAIDDRIAYIGSANFSKYSFKWRESILRMDESELTRIFRKIFLENFKTYKRKIKQRKYYKTIIYNGFKIIRETPSIVHQKSRNYFMRLISEAKKEITIVTPYFVTGKAFRDKLVKAVKRGVKVTVVVPLHSDVRMVDYLRDIFISSLSKKGVEFQMFTKSNLHAKLIMIDQKIFSIGSTNFDYRSFRYMYEINLSGKDPQIISLISQYMEDTLTECTQLNDTLWFFRPFHQKIIGLLLYPIRKLI